jgi:hypothetical protein
LSPHDVFTPFIRRFTDERARSTAEIRALYNRVTAAHRASEWGGDDALDRTAVAIMEAVAARVDLPEYEPLCEALWTCVCELLAFETTVFSNPAVNFSKPLSLREQVDLNRFLRAQEYFLAHEERISELLVNAVGNLAETLVASAPILSDGAFSVPLISLVPNQGSLLDSLIGIFFSRGHSEAGLFAELRDQLYRNLCAASGIPPDGNSKKPLVWPSEARLEPKELVDAYLSGTPLHSLLLTPCPFALPDEQRFSGQWVVAPPGRGKTTLLHSMVVHDLSQDASVILMDSKGDLLEPIKRLQGLADRLVLVEPDAEHPVALNPLDIPRASAHHAVSLLEYVFSSLLDAKMTSLQQTLFRSVLPALVTAVPNPTLEKFRDLMANGPAKYREYLERLPQDQRDFFFDKHNGFESKTYQETRNQLIWRLQLLMSNPVFKAMFAAPKTKLDIGKEMDAGKIILVNNSKSALGDEGAEFFGRFFIALILAAAQQRSGRSASEKLPSYVYIDECQTVISRDTKIATILDECRSQKIGLVLAHQRTEQIKDSDVLSALSNCAIRFANSDDEAKYLSEKLRASAEFLRSLGRGRFGAYVRDVTRSAVALDVTRVDFSRYAHLSDTEFEAIRTTMREQYGTSRGEPPIPEAVDESPAAAAPAPTAQPDSDAPAAW